MKGVDIQRYFILFFLSCRFDPIRFHCLESFLFISFRFIVIWDHCNNELKEKHFCFWNVMRQWGEIQKWTEIWKCRYCHSMKNVCICLRYGLWISNNTWTMNSKNRLSRFWYREKHFVNWFHLNRYFLLAFTTCAKTKKVYQSDTAQRGFLWLKLLFFKYEYECEVQENWVNVLCATFLEQYKIMFILWEREAIYNFQRNFSQNTIWIKNLNAMHFNCTVSSCSLYSYWHFDAA